MIDLLALVGGKKFDNIVYTPAVIGTSKEKQLVFGNSSSLQPYFYSNNVSDPDSAVIMSVNQPDFNIRQSVATIIIYYQEFEFVPKGGHA